MKQNSKKQFIKMMYLDESGLSTWQNAVKAGAVQQTETMQEYYTSEIINNTMIINVMGILTLNNIYFGTTYTGIASAVETAENSQDVEAIHLVIASVGGDVEGTSLACDALYSCKKPTKAIIKGNAFSGAYLLASQCDTIEAYNASEVGSVGVMQCYINEIDMLPLRMLRSSSAKNKNTDNARMLQGRIDNIERVMFSYIARGRGWEPSEVGERTGHGQCFIAGLAMNMGMIDRIIDTITVPPPPPSPVPKQDPSPAVSAETSEKERIQKLAFVCGDDTSLFMKSVEMGASIESVAIPLLRKLQREQKRKEIENQEHYKKLLYEEMAIDGLVFESLQMAKDTTTTDTDALIAEAFKLLDEVEGVNKNE